MHPVGWRAGANQRSVVRGGTQSSNPVRLSGESDPIAVGVHGSPEGGCPDAGLHPDQATRHNSRTWRAPSRLGVAAGILASRGGVVVRTRCGAAFMEVHLEVSDSGHLVNSRFGVYYDTVDPSSAIPRPSYNSGEPTRIERNHVQFGQLAILSKIFRRRHA